MTQSKLRFEALVRSQATYGRFLAFSVFILWFLNRDAHRWVTTVLLHLVFPSGHVTPLKCLWLILGGLLAAIHLTDFQPRWQLKTIVASQRWFRLDTIGWRRRLASTTAFSHIKVESLSFHGHVTLARFHFQLQGHFQSQVPRTSRFFLALDLPLATKWLLQGLQVVKMELPLAMPMQHVPGQEGTALQQSENYTIGQLYTFQTHEIDWKACLVVRLTLGALAWLPRHWNLLPSLHLAAYFLTHDEPSASRSSDPTTSRRDLFSCCVQNWRQGQTTTKSPVVRLSRPSNEHSLPFAMGSPIARYSTRPHRRGGVPRAHAEACRQIAEDARALQKVRFSLDVWVESVDRVAGRRKVGYLLTVHDTTLLSRRTVMRSAVTIKNAVLLLRLEHQLDREEVASERGTTRVDETQGNDGMEWQHLCVESREYRYAQIEHETSVVARVLADLVSNGVKKRSRWHLPQRCYQTQLEKATLYRCLMSPSRLPSVPSYHAIGIQLTNNQHEDLKVVCEVGIYRLHDAGDGTTPLLRQEWFILAVDHLHFFRSYSKSPALSVPIANVLDVCLVEHVNLLQGSHQRASRQEDTSSVPRWFGLAFHLVVEIITVFVETAAERDHVMACLHPLISDACTSSTGINGKALNASSPLFSPMVLDAQSQPVCLNQRTSRFVKTMPMHLNAGMAQKVVQESLEAGLHVFAVGAMAARFRKHRSLVLAFLNRVETLNCLDLDRFALDMTSDERLALGLNLYHTLFIHAVLVFGYPQTHEEWKLVQIVPCYLMRATHTNTSVRYTLSDIQRIILQCPVPVKLEASSLKRNLAQHALLDVAIGGGEAINGLCRTVLGVAWTPLLPTSSSYALIKTIPRPIATKLAIERADFRISMVLQINSTPPLSNTMGIMRVYDGGKNLSDQLTSTCTTFLLRELRLNEGNRTIYLPRICEWYRMGDFHEVDTLRQVTSLMPWRQRQSSSAAGVAASPTSRGFYCLQRLLNYMEVEQHHRAMHLLLGAGDECRFVFLDFWTHSSRSSAANFLTSAGNAALAVFTNGASAGTSRGEQSHDVVGDEADGGQRFSL